MNNWPSYLQQDITYDQFLSEFGFEDNANNRQLFGSMFRGIDKTTGEPSHVAPLKNFGFSPGPPVGLTDRSDHGRLMSDNKVLYDHPALHDKITGPAGDYRQGILDRGGESFEQEGRNFLTATDRFYNRDNWNEPKVYPGFTGDSGYALDHSVSPHPSAFTPGLITPGPQDPTVLSAPEGFLNRNSLLASRNITGPTGAFGPSDATALTADPSMYGGDSAILEAATESAATDSATGLSGPQAFAANMALNMIPTRDRKKVSTPFGDKGSASGILKGAGKGALTGATLGSVVPVVGTTAGAIGGGILGAIGGSQGYFDSTSAPVINMSRIKRGGGGMRGGLLGGGSMYG